MRTCARAACLNLVSNKYIQHVKTIYETYRPSSRVLCAVGYPIVFLSIENVRLLSACCSELQEARCEVPVIPPATLSGRYVPHTNSCAVDDEYNIKY
jgi:hypothetical protein